MDDDDGILIPLEQAAEQKEIAAAVEDWKRKKSETFKGTVIN